MSTYKLIYFEGCPNSKHARATLLTSGVDFDVIKQDELSKDDPFKCYSSPTILKGNEIVFGQRLSSGASACSAEAFDEQKIKHILSNQMPGIPKKKSRLLATFGSIGSAMTVGLCPICIPAIGAFLSSIGLGFLVTESVLLPVLIVFLVITIGGLVWSYLKEHGNIKPLILGIGMGIALYVGRYVYIGGLINSILMYGGIAGIIATSFWNLRLRKKASCPACVENP
ncbi:MAG: MerC domain-containing protein [Bdellovibrionales bacterium]|nr:MerC domain-containing protein [Bdellovibrionales bacterium]